MIVLDTSAFLAHARRELGAEPVDAVLAEAAMSAVNVAEVLSKVVDWGLDADAYTRNLAAIGVEFVEFNFARATIAAQLRPATRAMGLSLGDRACLALAVERQCPAMTADRNWAKLNIGVPIRLIR